MKNGTTFAAFAPVEACLGRRTRSAGFTLVELMIVVAIIGILASIAIPAFSRTVKKARTAEAAGHLNRIWSGALTYYEADHASAAGAMVAKRFPGNPTQETNCCLNPGDQCLGNAATYRTNVNWVALGFNIPDRHYYRPGFSSSGTGAAATFVASANGDLDCDGTLSTFTRRARITGGDVVGVGSTYTVRAVE